MSTADKERLINALKRLSENSDIENTVSVDEVIKYFVVHNFVVNGDSYTGSMIHNYYLYEKDGVMSMLPWDYNLAFGSFQSTDATSSVNYPIDSPVSGGDMSDRPMIAWIFGNEEYTNLYHKYFSQFITEYFDSGNFEKEIDFVTELISPYVEKDPTKFCDYDSFVLGASTLKKFCMLRAESVGGQLNGTISSSDSSESDSLLSSKVDASGINISDMGSMMHGGRGGTDDVPEKPNMPAVNDASQSETENQSPPSQEETTSAVQTEPNTVIPQGGMPEMPQQGEMPQGGINPFGNGETPPQRPAFGEPNVSFNPNNIPVR